MTELLKTIFTSGNFEPHSVHFIGNPWPMYLIMAGNAISFLAYLLIPIVLVYLVRKRKDLVFNWMFLLFGAFIAACGLTHLFHVLIFWWPAYWLQAIIDILTWAVSIGTSIALFFVIPQIVKLTTPKQIEEVNAQIALQIEKQKQAEADLQTKNKDLEGVNKKINGQIAELAKMNELMQGREARITELTAELALLKNRK